MTNSRKQGCESFTTSNINNRDDIKRKVLKSLESPNFDNQNSSFNNHNCNFDNRNAIPENTTDITKNSFKTVCDDENKNIRTLIRKIYRMGYNADDIKNVIDKKCNHWLDTKFERYWRPIILFREEKFKYFLIIF